jgi:hypothetical protein
MTRSITIALSALLLMGVSPARGQRSDAVFV